MIQMNLQLQPLSDRPELFARGADGIIYNEQRPYDLLSSECSSGFREKICISLSIPYAASSLLHYAGSNDWQFSAYFYTKKGGFLQQNYFLVTVNLRTLDFRIIRETESPSVRFCHRQPYYLLRTSVFAQTYNVMHFENYGNPVSVNLGGLVLDDSLLLFKDGKLFVLRNGKKERRELCDNTELISYPDLAANCTAYSNPLETMIYVTFATKSGLLIIDTTTFAMEVIELLQILDIRCAKEGELIFANTQQPQTELVVLRLPDRYWKSKMAMEEQLRESGDYLLLEELRSSIRLHEHKIGKLEMELEASRTENIRLQKPSKKMRLLGFVLVALLGVITILGAHSLASLLQEVTVLMVTIFVGVLFVRSSSADHPEQAQIPSESQAPEEQQQSSYGLTSISDDAAQIAAQKAELEKKYRRMLMRVGRQQTS
ncbi:hypothetical protein PRIPAC_93790 [Pristionchus pacificus]|uniref:Uncharacterized protein n=1 Tax=Pristionchus pacificus TaxID=54126 RepID=A0A2A6BAG9_PRIPA|nr:hypothetical protein PRIPAC_93790 [Pristionchus pacificus]|eukprot:PDM62841.1 hypothetical protein PRIPAC_50056 [Pristionchus pacificus]